MQSKRRQRLRPGNAAVIVILFNNRRDQASDAHAVATHYGRGITTILIQDEGPHRFAVCAVELENMPNFDAA